MFNSYEGDSASASTSLPADGSHISPFRPYEGLNSGSTASDSSNGWNTARNIYSDATTSSVVAGAAGEQAARPNSDQCKDNNVSTASSAADSPDLRICGAVQAANDSTRWLQPLLLGGVVGGTKAFGDYIEKQVPGDILLKQMDASSKNLIDELSRGSLKPEKGLVEKGAEVVAKDSHLDSLEKLLIHARGIQDEASKVLEQHHVRFGDAQHTVESMMHQYKSIDAAHPYGANTREILREQHKFANNGFKDSLRSADIKARTGTLEELVKGNPAAKDSPIFLKGSTEAQLAHDVRISKHIWEQNRRTGRLENNIDNLIDANSSKRALKAEVKSRIDALKGIPEMTADDLHLNKSRAEFLEKVIKDPTIAKEGIGHEIGLNKKLFVEGSDEAKALLNLAESHSDLLKARETVGSRTAFNEELHSMLNRVSNVGAEAKVVKPGLIVPAEIKSPVSVPAAGLEPPPMKPPLNTSIGGRALATMRGAGKSMALGLGAGLAGQAFDGALNNAVGLGTTGPNDLHAISDTTIIPIILQAPIPVLPKIAAVSVAVAVSRVDTFVKALSQRH